MRSLIDSTDFLHDPTALRERLVEEGYLYLPGFLPADDMIRVRTILAQSLTDHGWLTDPHSLTMASPGLQFSGESFSRVYPSVQQVEDFHRLAQHSRFTEVTEALLGGPVFCHPARVLRLATPRESRYTTRAHQDFAVLHVTSDVLTCWVTFTQCDSEQQGLRLIPRSHRNGYLPTDETQGGSRPLYLGVAPDDPRWVTADYAPGDLVLFHSLTVHAGGPNRSDRLRMSMDIRYQRDDEPLLSEFTHPHGWPRTPDWDQLADGWADRSLHALPPGVRIVHTDPDTPYHERLQGLRAPRSRLLDRE
ncbi:phytanoyl-CoA dioxygenase family protein [Nocardiopsis sp. NPDC007018]|uniref:phytanoyl-CoA dioxygenase family protein n=1 Tax=Nocardiopsis sp. NPDC007018 TaxID=3155721 RepID=UPI0033E60F54